MTSRAVIIGGGIGGLCSASALSGHFDEVVLIEKDRLPETAAHRRGLPQARYVHSLLERGRIEMEGLFPGFTEAMLERGVPLLDFGRDVAALRAGGWMPRHPCGIETLWPSRPAVDVTLRQLLRRIANVTVADGTTACGIEIDSARGRSPRATGVMIAGPDGSRLLAADLVVDAGGRGTQMPKWLRAASIEPPGEETVDAGAGYSARLYQAPTPDTLPPHWWWRGIVAECAPPEVLTGGVLFPIEDGRWLVTLMGFNGHFPPTEEGAFERFARGLRTPLIAEAMARAIPLSPIAATRSLANRRRRYDRWATPVSGLVGIGDAVCSMNPIYGQGMAVSAASAALLKRCAETLDPRCDRYAPSFHAAQAALLETPWRMSTAADFCYPGTTGRRDPGSRLREIYLNAVMEAGWADPVLHRKIVRVIHMVDSPAELLRPAVAARTALRSGQRLLRRRLKAGRTGEPPRLPPTSPLDDASATR